MKKILLYGFGDYLNYTNNPSRRVVNALYIRHRKKYQITKRVFKVSYKDVRAGLDKVLPAKEYDIVLGFGLSAGATRIRLERMALNLHDSKRPDADGRVMENKLILKDAPGAYHCDVPVAAIARALRKKNIPTLISHDPGAYVCNSSYFHVLHHLAGFKTKALFVHIPMSSETVCRQRLDYPSLPFSMLSKATEVIFDMVVKK